MLNKYDRPVLVWVILIWFLIVGTNSLYELPSLVEVLEGIFEQRRDTVNYIQVIFFSVISMTAAVMLFRRYAANRWLFVIMLMLNVINMFYLVFYESISDEYIHSAILLASINMGLFTLITYYTFRLLDKGYYIECC